MKLSHYNIFISLTSQPEGFTGKQIPVIMSIVIAKFHISSKTKTMGYDPQGNKAPTYKIEGHAVYTGSEENNKFFNATPYGKLELGVLNKAAADQIEPGNDYYITIEKAPEKEKPSNGMHA